MKFKVKQIKPLNIWHFVFDKQSDMTLSLLRLQEFYESPKFRRKFFYLDEYIQWYSEKYKTAFDYHVSVGAHNIPGHEFRYFFREFDQDLTNKEQEVIDSIFENVDALGCESGSDEDFYIIATCKDLPDHAGYFGHELRHAFFYLIPEYKRDILGVLKKYATNRDVKKFRNALSKDYGKNVVNDEMQAYALTGYNPYDESKRIKDLPKGLRELRNDLKEIERKYYKSGKLV